MGTSSKVCRFSRKTIVIVPTGGQYARNGGHRFSIHGNVYGCRTILVVFSSGKEINDCAMTPQALAALVKMAAAGTINGPTLKELLPEIFEKGGDPEAIVKERGLGAVNDTAALEAFVDQAIAANPGPVADFKAGKKAAAGFFVGQVMKLSKGKADPKIVGKLVAQKLAAC